MHPPTFPRRHRRLEEGVVWMGRGRRWWRVSRMAGARDGVGSNHPAMSAAAAVDRNEENEREGHVGGGGH